ncbi:hypothetical protein, partial [Pseudolactococcus raffinolactis]|uniref:hypothetical protein n=1 Tax=Pseudolactococcus raffinolactis TaxID=1366 RepID=UPI001C706AC6
FSIILPYLIVDLKLCNRTVKRKGQNQNRSTWQHRTILQAPILLSKQLYVSLSTKHQTNTYLSK